MKLVKSWKGKALITAYYIVIGTGIFFLALFIMFQAGILAGLAAAFALGAACGIIGGELEFIEHRKARYKEYVARKGTEEHGKTIAFTGN